MIEASPQHNTVELDQLCIAYLSCPQDSANGYLGALLLTDGRTRPLHFGYVAPVRPTVTQRILYGRTLDRHVKIDVIVSKLKLEGMNRVPDVIFVDSEDLLEARQVFGVPTAKLSRQPESQNAVRISNYTYQVGEGTDDQQRVGTIVAALEQTVDLLNPFERMLEALKESLKQSPKKETDK